MIDIPDDTTLVERGTWGTVRYAVRLNGKMEAREWLQSADQKKQAKFSHLFRRITSEGIIWNEQQFRNLGDGIYEFKKNSDRILAFQDSNCWLLTHHYLKKSGKCPKAQIERAKVIRSEHFLAKQKSGEK